MVVCVYNRATQVQSCLASLIAKQHTGVEFVLVNDGSTDDTARVLEELRAAYPQHHISVIHNDSNLGLSAARNVGSDAAVGEFVFFIDSDCTVGDQWLRHMLAAFTDPGVVAVAGVSIDHVPRNYAESVYTGATRIGMANVQGRKLVGNNMGFRREVLAAYGFDHALKYYCDEDELAWRLTADGHTIAFAPDAIVHHDHPMTVGKHLRLGRLQGQGSARFWYKQGKFIGRDVLPVTLALLTLPLGLIHFKLLSIPLFFALIQIAALVYNQYALKGKTLLTAIKSLPLDVGFYCFKATSVYFTLGRILLGYEPAIRESKRQWWESRQVRSDARTGAA